MSLNADELQMMTENDTFNTDMPGLPVGEWVLPIEPWKSAVIPVRCHPCIARLDGECGKIGVRDQVASGIYLAAQINEDLPVMAAWGHNDPIRVIENGFGKEKGRLKWCRRVKDFRMGHHS